MDLQKKFWRQQFHQMKQGVLQQKSVIHVFKNFQDENKNLVFRRAVSYFAATR